MAKLKAAMLAADTLGELHALMEDYSYMEFMQIYNQLTLEQQAQLNVIDERDSKAQMLATVTAKAPVAEGKQLSQLTASGRERHTKNKRFERPRLSAICLSEVK